MTQTVTETKQTANCNNSWTDSEINTLAKALTFCWKNSDQYGGDLELQSRVDAFKFVLEGIVSVELICGAIRAHMGESTDMVKPAHVKTMLFPEKAKITQTEFIHAKEQHKLTGYNPYSEWAQTIRDFEAQEREERGVHTPQEILERRAIPAVHPALQKRLDDHNKEKEENEKKLLT